ncbi:class I adenylate-forming enzyme family protein [Sporolactobacillus sp. KGMB 08714]|uniref:class I adenylate-forming enzyme family protein n=1 Tax=Sporolactobacillus sp. KGMB 08714 TaxID=3064704 RepID=UPI002FBEBBD0
MFNFRGKVLSEQRINEYLDKGIWENESFVDVLKADVEKNPDLIHKDERQSLSYKELWEKVEALAAEFYRMGIRKGDRIAMQLPNTLDYVLAIFGASRIGAVSVLLQVDLGENAIIKSLKQSQSKLWITVDSYRGHHLWQRALEIKKEVPSLVSVIVQGDVAGVPDSVPHFEALKNSGRKLSEDVLQENAPGPADGFVMVFTSGTTGSPKGVVQLHGNYLWAARAYAKNFGYMPGDCVLDVAPIAHQTGMLAGIMMTIATGGRIVLLDRFSAKRVLDWTEQEKAAFIIGAPPHVTHMANYSGLEEADTSSVKVFIYAGASVPSAILRRLQETSGIQVGCLFGWTEGFVATLTRPDDPIEAVSKTVGFVVPGEEVKLVDEEGKVVERGEAGEMWSRGPNFCAGYFELPEFAAKQWDREGWFHSGDLLRQDENGRYTFLGRSDDIINRGGTKIDPKSVEDVLGGFPGVGAVNVVGAPHPTLGAQTVACVVLQEGRQAFRLDELRDYLGVHGLAKFQFPDRLEFFDELPRTESGKPKKNVLREWVLERIKADHLSASERK